MIAVEPILLLTDKSLGHHRMLRLQDMAVSRLGVVAHWPMIRSMIALGASLAGNQFIDVASAKAGGDIRIAKAASALTWLRPL